ncbi:MAG: hypothetical protein LBE13_16540 [Bacteroidales bacterium]|jgi:hypothetical protein|nr:hypothetical protein [Bacteroidales bacterium]
MPDNNNSIYVTGRLYLSAYSKRKKKLWDASGRNLVVNSGYDTVVRALTGSPGAHITQVAAGTNGSHTQVTDTQITDATVLNIQDVEYLQPNKVRFHFTVKHEDCIGMNIREFGLITSDGQLFSRKVLEGIEKTDSFCIVGVWEINVH